jgi:very-short-patch-repair endonuclease
MLPYNPGLKPPARVLRRTMTDAERPLWSRVQGKQYSSPQRLDSVLSFGMVMNGDQERG